MSAITDPLEQLAQEIFWQARLARFHLAMTKAGFKPDQLRDDHGQWTGGGSGARASTIADFSAPGVSTDISPRYTTEERAIKLYNDLFLRPPADLKQEILRGVRGGVSAEKSQIVLDFGFSEAHTVFNIRNSAGDLVGEMARGFRRDMDGNLIVNHGDFWIGEALQGGGIAKDLLRNSFEEYRLMGVDRVTLMANVDVGGYAWARYGFLPTAGGWRDLRGDLETRLDEQANSWGLTAAETADIKEVLKSRDVASIRKVADLNKIVVGEGGKPVKLGQALLLGTHWNGEISLKDEKSMDRFNRYIGRP